MDKKEISEKYGETLFTGQYVACLVATMNEDGSYDIGYDGGFIQCMGLAKAIELELSWRYNRETEE